MLDVIINRARHVSSTASSFFGDSLTFYNTIQYRPLWAACDGFICVALRPLFRSFQIESLHNMFEWKWNWIFNHIRFVFMKFLSIDFKGCMERDCALVIGYCLFRSLLKRTSDNLSLFHKVECDTLGCHPFPIFENKLCCALPLTIFGSVITRRVPLKKQSSKKLFSSNFFYY